MGVGDALRDFARFLEDCDGGTVNGVEFTDRLGPDGDLDAEVELTVGIDSAIDRSTARVDDNGRLVITFESAEPVVPATGSDLEVNVTDVRLDAEGAISVDLSTAVRSTGFRSRDERNTELSVEPVASLDAPTGSGDEIGVDGCASTPNANRSEERTERDRFDRTRDVPPFEDRELLKEVYESCDTFSEMADAIGMDVTGETVRRYMIDHGIHQPNTYNTNGGRHEDEPGNDQPGDEESDVSTEEDDSIEDSDGLTENGVEAPVVVPDGMGLPDGITVETIVETVKRSNTIYEVEKNLDVDHETSLEMLREFDLLDLVVGRLATEGERDIEREEIVERLRRNSATR